jgi:hypothetical protein
VVDQPPWKKPRPCKDCGGLFDPKWPSSRRCEACHQNRLRQPDCSAAKCLICGRTFVRIRGSYAKRCASCIEAKAIPPRAPEPRRSKAEARTPRQIRSGLCVSCGVSHGRYPTAKRCLACAAARDTEVHRESRKRNPEAARSRKRAWRAENAERHLAGHSAWKAANRGRLNEYKRDYDNHRKRTDHIFKLVGTVRSRVATALRASRLKGQRVTARGALRYLGCPFDDFARHIESQFTDGMNWENFGKGGWHVDHIYPLGRADLTDPVELQAAFNWRNCRPLWEAENMIKQAKVTPEAAELFAELKATFSPL